MNYNEALNFILSKQRLGVKPGLSRISALLEKMGNPQNSLKIIHIAGTNGKGTIAKTINDALISCGCKVGLFTSPYVVDYTEQIQIDNTFISNDDFAFYVDKYKDNDCTEFEFLTAIMYKYFSDNNVYYAVVECGMGGMGDATNVEKSNISVITYISLDHTDFFGNSIEDIAREKSGIIKSGCSCVLYPNKLCESVFEKRCAELNARLIKVQDGGSILSNNLNTVNEVLDILNVKRADRLSCLPARIERRNGILLDGGHNPSAAENLSGYIDKEVALIGMMHDKDVEKYLSVVAPHCTKIITTTPNNSRSMPCESLKAVAQKYCNDVVAVEKPAEALQYAREHSLSLVCGSFYLIREIINLI